MKRRFKKFKSNTNLANIINENNVLIFMVFCLLTGLLAGVLLFKLKNTNGIFYKSEFAKYITDCKKSISGVFFSCLLQILPYIAVTFIAGTSMVGSVIAPLVIAVRGADLGFVMGYLYEHFGLNGIIFNLLIIIPSAALTSIALILSGREAFGFSLSLLRLAVPESKSVMLDNDFKLYSMRQLFMLLIYLLGIVLETLMTVSFLPFFKFT